VIPELRKQFNRCWNPARYAEFLRRLDETAGTHVGFRCSETPVFLPSPLLEKMIRYGQELYGQLGANEFYRTASEAAIPRQFRVPNESVHPLFVQADFGLIRDAGGELEPRLVEIQGFPSIYALQAALAAEYRNAFDLDGNLNAFLGGLTEQSYFDLLRRVILNGHAPEEVILLEIDPYRQKTLPDFLLTRKQLGIKIACIRDIKRQGSKLYFEGAPVKRIYNRVIVDELLRKDVKTEFSFTDELEVEWAGHPNWFFRLSKFSLPWFRHVSVPETWFLDELPELPGSLDEFVLKPLYSFAGSGVKISPSKEEIAAIPEDKRHEFILQRKMDFVPTIDTPAGMTKIEVRIMYIWDGELKPVTTVLRTGRGKMMGVDFNKDLDWVGASAGFYPAGKGE
jgi:hypothetical protein